MGFVGSHLVDLLVSKGMGVVSFDNMEPQVHPNKKPVYLNKKAHYALSLFMLCQNVTRKKCAC